MYFRVVVSFRSICIDCRSCCTKLLTLDARIKSLRISVGLARRPPQHSRPKTVVKSTYSLQVLGEQEICKPLWGLCQARFCSGSAQKTSVRPDECFSARKKRHSMRRMHSSLLERERRGEASVALLAGVMSAVRHDSYSPEQKNPRSSHGMGCERLSMGVDRFLAQEFCIFKQENVAPSASRQARTDVPLTSVLGPLHNACRLFPTPVEYCASRSRTRRPPFAPPPAPLPSMHHFDRQA